MTLLESMKKEQDIVESLPSIKVQPAWSPAFSFSFSNDLKTEGKWKATAGKWNERSKKTHLLEGELSSSLKCFIQTWQSQRHKFQRIFVFLLKNAIKLCCCSDVIVLWGMIFLINLKCNIALDKYIEGLKSHGGTASANNSFLGSYMIERAFCLPLDSPFFTQEYHVWVIGEANIQTTLPNWLLRYVGAYAWLAINMAMLFILCWPLSFVLLYAWFTQ